MKRRRRSFAGFVVGLHLTPAAHISTSLTVGDLPTQFEHAVLSWLVAVLPAHTTQTAPLPQTYSLIASYDLARPAERERAVKGAPYLWEKKKINLRKLVNDT